MKKKIDQFAEKEEDMNEILTIDVDEGDRENILKAAQKEKDKDGKSKVVLKRVRKGKSEVFGEI